MKSRKPPGIGSGSEVHDKKGIEKMRASGRLAAQVLQYAGTLVKVIYGVPSTQVSMWHSLHTQASFRLINQDLCLPQLRRSVTDFE